MDAQDTDILISSGSEENLHDVNGAVCQSVYINDVNSTSIERTICEAQTVQGTSDSGTFGVCTSDALKSDCTSCDSTYPCTTCNACTRKQLNAQDAPSVPLNGDCHQHGVTASINSFSLIKVFRRRWYILFVYSLFSFVQGALVDVYAVVAVSCEKAFHWSDTQISSMQTWIYLCFLIAIFPSCWLIDAKGNQEKLKI